MEKKSILLRTADTINHLVFAPSGVMVAVATDG
jgi:hypothetical protein